MKTVVALLLIGCAAAQNFNRFFSPPGVQRFQQQQQQPRQSFSAQQNQIGRDNVDDHNGNSLYHYSWRHGSSSLTGQGAHSYCRNLGGSWAAVSINDAGEDSYINRVIQGERLQYIWTGGQRSGRGFSWPDGTGVSYNNWSHTGGRQSPQPDNREARESGGRRSEDCLAILNNFYRDGVKWHDVECSHRKPVVCEKRA